MHFTRPLFLFLPVENKKNYSFEPSIICCVCVMYKRICYIFALRQKRRVTAVSLALFLSFAFSLWQFTLSFSLSLFLSLSLSLSFLPGNKRRDLTCKESLKRLIEVASSEQKFVCPHTEAEREVQSSVAFSFLPLMTEEEESANTQNKFLWVNCSLLVSLKSQL